MHNSHNIHFAIPESHLEDDNKAEVEAFVSLPTLLLAFEESSPFLGLVSEIKITLTLTESVQIKLSSD